MKRYSLLLLIGCFSLCCNNKKEEEKPNPSVTDKKDTTTTRPDITINSYAPIDISPMDMSYYPADYPKLKMTKSDHGAPKARVVYSRPHLQGRKLFHDVLKYGEAWRLGANEATELDLYTDATIQDKKIKAGRYVLYCIPAENNWTIVFNSNIDSWGLQQDVTKDIARFQVPVKQTGNSLEFFTMVFEATSENTTDLLMAWDNIEARLPLSF